MMSSAILQADHLTLVSSQGSIVEDLSFQVAPGEIVALTGKSGSGKTSIALAILNLLPQGITLKNGTIQWSGADHHTITLPGNPSAWALLRGTHIGYTQQDVFGAFDPVLPMGKQMMMIIRERSPQQKIDKEHQLRIKMEEVGLHDIDRLWKSYPHQLSGGQLQRCQIAMAVVIQPALLISDEPTSAIDKINQLELLNVLSMLRQKYNMAILCITHEETVVRHLADREINLDDNTVALPLPVHQHSEKSTAVSPRILDIQGLEYTHTYGGMMYKKGARVGPMDFTVDRGTCLGIVGESGSGKSTLAQLLVGLIFPARGQVVLEGKAIHFRNANDVKWLRSKIQLVMQDGRGSLHPYMTIGDILKEVTQTSKTIHPRAKTDLVQALKEVGLPESVLGRRPSRLSGGECLRVSIARALLMQPEILICDESTSALDGPTRDGIIDLLQHLMTDRGLALIFISHDERIIRGLANHVLVLAEGKVVEKGPLDEVTAYPTHPVTKKIFAPNATPEDKQRL
jgi:ABC-type glutathione transport system ATPase component